MYPVSTEWPSYLPTWCCIVIVPIDHIMVIVSISWECAIQCHTLLLSPLPFQLWDSPAKMIHSCSPLHHKYQSSLKPMQHAHRYLSLGHRQESHCVMKVFFKDVHIALSVTISLPGCDRERDRQTDRQNRQIYIYISVVVINGLYLPALFIFRIVSRW